MTEIQKAPKVWQNEELVERLARYLNIKATGLPPIEHATWLKREAEAREILEIVGPLIAAKTCGFLLDRSAPMTTQIGMFTRATNTVDIGLARFDYFDMDTENELDMEEQQ